MFTGSGVCSSAKRQAKRYGTLEPRINADVIEISQSVTFAIEIPVTLTWELRMTLLVLLEEVNVETGIFFEIAGCRKFTMLLIKNNCKLLTKVRLGPHMDSKQQLLVLKIREKPDYITTQN